jgi:adenylate kinase family enzyme
MAKADFPRVEEQVGIELGRHILVVGTTGSGKTTVAAALAQASALPHIELDALHWESGWREADTAVFQARLRESLAAAADGWVIDGNYLTKADEITSEAADTLVFLDLALPVVLIRLVRRTIRRSLTKQELWTGNRERLRSLCTRDSLLVWAVRTHRRNRHRYGQRIRDPRWSYEHTVHLTTRAEVRAFLAELAAR